MSKTIHSRQPAWHKRFKGPAIRATIKTSEGNFIDLTMPLTDQQVMGVLDLILPSPKTVKKG